MLYIGQVKYKHEHDSEWENGWIVGDNIDNPETLLDSNFKPVPKIFDEGKEYFGWDYKRVVGVEIQV